MREDPTRRWLLGAALLGGGALAAGCGPAAAASPVRGRKVLWRQPFPFAGGADDSFGLKLVTAAPGLVLAGHGGNLYAFDPSTGKPRWNSPNGPYDSTGTVRAPAAIAGPVVLTLRTTQQSSTLFALNATTGRPLWQATGAPDSLPAAPGATAGGGSGGNGGTGSGGGAGSLVFFAADGHLNAYDTRTGHIRWRHRATGPSTVRPVASGPTVYATDGTHLTALHAANGHILWRRPLGPAQVLAAPTALYTLTDRLTVLDPHTGHTRRESHPLDVLRKGARDTTLANNTLYLANTGGEPPYLWALDATTGHTRWTFTAAKAIQGPATATPTTVYTGDSSGKLYALDAKTGHPHWTLDTAKAPVNAPTATATTVYAIIASAPDAPDPTDHLYALQA
ncbi:MAG TPA: PQQ-binding-like beta-propeller repeat protein [Streptosporangiaceae bacterium]|jgi:outer membrane protein assembly factor BamB